MGCGIAPSIFIWRSLPPMHTERRTDAATSLHAPHLFVAYCLERDTLLRSAKTALVVGTLLALINHGQQILSRQFALSWVLPTLVTYLVPFCVATYGQVQAKRQRDHLQTGPSATDSGGPPQPGALHSREDVWWQTVEQHAPGRRLQVAPRFTLPTIAQATKSGFHSALLPGHASQILLDEDHVS